MPTEGSKAWHDRQERLTKKGKLPAPGTTETIEEETPRQRNQPVRKRGKKRK
jgi:hypothetical protein